VKILSQLLCRLEVNDVKAKRRGGYEILQPVVNEH
jgi:hypothetical protein